MSRNAGTRPLTPPQNLAPIHIIRLRGPWEYIPLSRMTRLEDGTIAEDQTNLPPRGKAKMPCDWAESLGNDFCGRVRYERRFGRPANLTSELVYLAFEQVNGSANVTLNENLLGQIPAGGQSVCFDVTQLLEKRNCLAVEVISEVVSSCEKNDKSIGGIVGEVRLELFY